MTLEDRTKLLSPSFTVGDVVVEAKKRVYDGFFKINQYQIRHRLYDGGQSGSISRELFERGDAAAVLPYDPITDEVVLVEQFRVGALGAAVRDEAQAQVNKVKVKNAQSPWLIECIAGMVDKGREAQQVAICEAQEEAAIPLRHLTEVMRYFSTPGGMSERVTLFVAIVDSTTAGGIHGLDTEHEDIKVLRVKYSTALQWLDSGKLNNATTIIALQWLQLHKERWLASLDQST